MLQDVRGHNLPRQVAPFELPAPKYHCLNDNETILNPALSPREEGGPWVIVLVMVYL